MAEDNDSANKDKPAMAEDPNTLHVLNQQRNWDTLYFYQKSDVVYQLAFAFCDRLCATTPSRSAILSTR